MGLMDTAIDNNAAIQLHKIRGGVGLDSMWGNVLYVQSTHPNANDGSVGSFAAPFKTMRAAANMVDDYDTIIVGPGHVETITVSGGSVGDFSGKTGVQIIGCGTGRSRPTITCSVYTGTRAFSLAGNDLLVRNFRMVAAIASLTNLIYVSGADDVTIEDCEFNYSGTGRAVDAITLTTGTTRPTVRRCTFIGSQASGQDSAIHCEVASVDRMTIEDCDFDGAYAQAVIENITNAMTNVRILRNRFMQFTAANTIKAHASTTGIIAYNGGWSPQGVPHDTNIINAAGAQCVENYFSESAASKSAILTPTATT